jgi:hypothetical protein
MRERVGQSDVVAEMPGAPPAWAIAVALLPMIGSWVAMALTLALPNGRARYGLLLAAGFALALGYGLTVLLAQRYPDERKRY